RAHDVAALHALVVLRPGEPDALARPAELEAGTRPERIRGTDRIAVEPVLREPSRAAVPEVDRDRAVGVTGSDPDGGLHRPPAEDELDDVLARHAEALRGDGREVDG